MNEFLKNLEYLSYRPVQNDPYGLLGIVSIRAYGKFLLVYKHQRTKDQTGTFFCSANIMLQEPEKKYIPTISLDSRGDDQIFADWIRDRTNAFLQMQRQPMAQSASVHPTNHAQMAQNGSIFDSVPF